MKVDRNQPVQKDPDWGNYGAPGIPLRLEIAARMLPDTTEGPEFWMSDEHMMMACHNALKWADALIQVHNKTCGEEK